MTKEKKNGKNGKKIEFFIYFLNRTVHYNWIKFRGLIGFKQFLSFVSVFLPVLMTTGSLNLSRPVLAPVHG